MRTFSFKQFKKNIYELFGGYDEDDATEDEKYLKNIIEAILVYPDIKKVMVPTGDTLGYLLIDEVNQIYISIEDSKIDMSNHNFLYKKNFNLNYTNMLMKIIKANIEEERKELKASLFDNEMELLVKIGEMYK